MRPAQSNFVTFSETPESLNDSGASDRDDEEEVFVATRATKKINKPISDRTRSQYRRSGPIIPRVREKESSPVERGGEPEEVSVPTVSTPYSIDHTIFNPTNEDAFMEDDEPRDSGPKEPQSQIPKRPPHRLEVPS